MPVGFMVNLDSALGAEHDAPRSVNLMAEPAARGRPGFRETDEEKDETR